jgi:hypothetical protein
MTNSASAQGFSGTPSITYSVQDGDWDDPSTWDQGLPSLAGFIDAVVESVVVVDSSGNSAEEIGVGFLDSGSLFIAAGGELEAYSVFVGLLDEEGTLLMSGGELSVLTDTYIGHDATGLLKMREGVFSSDRLVLGDTDPSGAGTLEVLSSDPAVTIGSQLKIGSQGRLKLTPFENGSFGLSAIQTVDLDYSSGSTIELDVHAYSISVGDSWDIITYSGSKSGHATHRVAPIGYAFVEDQSTPGVIKITITEVPAWSDEECALAGVSGDPLLEGFGSLASGSNNSVDLSNAATSANAGFFMAPSSTPVPFKGGTLKPFPFLSPIFLTTSALGEVAIPFTMPAGIPAGIELWAQWAIQDTAAVAGVALSNAIRGVTP